MAGLFFDANGNGHLDLYVVSGGYRFPPADPRLQDRLYLNDGQGHFTHAPDDALPNDPTAGSAVVAADLDRNGQLELFVAGRLVPGRWPRPPRHRILRREGGRFVDATDRIAPDLADAGMVSSALWSDATGNGWPDLLLACEYGPVRLFANQGGYLVERTAEAGLAHLTGLWNGIAAGDLTGNGAIDYVVTNLGLNTPYPDARHHPLVLYHGDLDGSGTEHLVEGYRDQERWLPLRDRLDVQRVLPLIGERFATYHGYASATLEQIYGPGVLDDAYRLEVRELRSGVLINDGAGRFQFRPLPRLAQASAAFGVLLEDFDGDGHLDLYLAHNFYDPQPKTPRLDGGVGLLLRGRGDGDFEVVWPDRSGLLVPEDARAAATADLSGDGSADLLVTTHAGPLRLFANRIPQPPLLRVRLQGPPGNPQAVGARVRLQRDGHGDQVRELYAGGGYLAQSAPTLRFANGPDPATLHVTWPDGNQTRHDVPPEKEQISLEAPPHP